MPYCHVIEQNDICIIFIITSKFQQNYLQFLNKFTKIQKVIKSNLRDPFLLDMFYKMIMSKQQFMYFFVWKKCLIVHLYDLQSLLNCLSDF